MKGARSYGLMEKQMLSLVGTTKPLTAESAEEIAEDAEKGHEYPLGQVRKPFTAEVAEAVRRDNSAFVDSCVGVIVAPVEPIIFKGGDAVEAFALGRAGDGAALEVPFAGSRGVKQGPGWRGGGGRGFGCCRRICFGIG